MTLATLLTDYYSPLKGISARTVEIYGFTLKAWGDLLGRAPELRDLEELTVARFLQHRQRTREAATAAKDRCQIRALWEFAARRKMVDTWPILPRIVVPERVPQAWLTEEMQRLIDSAGQEQGIICGLPKAKWWRLLLLVSYESGERVGSLLALRWMDIQGCNVLFRAEARKGRRRDILREISVRTADELIAFRGARSGEDLVFPWQGSYPYMYRRLGVILARAGLPTDRKSKFHRIRKTTASYYEAAGGDAQKLLDHASPVTKRAYIDPRIVKRDSAPDVIPKVS